MAVAKEYRGKHVAQGLENYRLKLLRKRNIKRADLLMAPSNTAVIGLARKVGFRIIGTYRGLLFGTIDLEKIE
jgi:ribosomal protein S18 acetylase RimI-like enzyme